MRKALGGPPKHRILFSDRNAQGLRYRKPQACAAQVGQALLNNRKNGLLIGLQKIETIQQIINSFFVFLQIQVNCELVRLENRKKKYKTDE